MKDFFIDKFEYNHLCNFKMIELIEANPEAYTKKAQILICHTLNAQNVWSHRLLENPPSKVVWEVFPLSELQKLNDENHSKSIEVINKIDLTSTINYNDTSGTPYSNKVEDMLFHIINHSTYHRGQLMTELKTQGVTTIPVDFIFFKR